MREIQTSEATSPQKTPLRDIIPAATPESLDLTILQRAALGLAAGAVAAVTIYEVNEHVKPFIRKKIDQRRNDSALQKIYGAAFQ